VPATQDRRSIRRAFRTVCQAVRAQSFRLFGEQVLDLSPRGMLVRCDRVARLGERVLVSFRAPGNDGLWLDAEATVARLVQDQRSGDRGVCAGLEFVYFERSARHELLVRLAGFPPPVPQRRLRTARERAEARARAGSVLVHRILTLDEPIFPLVRRRAAPRGVFAA
jgi:hypothetical protein